MNTMKIQKWLSLAYAKLKESGVVSFQLDGLILLEHVTGFDKACILAHQDEELSNKQILELSKLLSRRCKREPIAYITSKKEFYGREFIVDKNVLIPRPESESFIDLLKKHNITYQKIADIGCGSGILGISAKLELLTNTVTLTDIDYKALIVAENNAKNLGAKCSIVQSDLIPTNNDYTVILANLPYVPQELKLEPDLNYEPKIALYAKNHGMEIYDRLWQQIHTSKNIRYVLTESLVAQHKAMIKLAEPDFKLIDTDGLVQLFSKN